MLRGHISGLCQSRSGIKNLRCKSLDSREKMQGRSNFFMPSNCKSRCRLLGSICVSGCSIVQIIHLHSTAFLMVKGCIMEGPNVVGISKVFDRKRKLIRA